MVGYQDRIADVDIEILKEGLDDNRLINMDHNLVRGRVGPVVKESK